MRHKRMFLRRIPLDSSGYDDMGMYWGVGLPLYRYEWEEHLYNVTGYVRTEVHSNYIRARDREHAKEIIKATHRGARFYT